MDLGKKVLLATNLLIATREIVPEIVDQPEYRKFMEIRPLLQAHMESDYPYNEVLIAEFLELTRSLLLHYLG